MTFLPEKPSTLLFRVGKAIIAKYIKDYSLSPEKTESAKCNVLSLLYKLARYTRSKSVVSSKEMTFVIFFFTTHPRVPAAPLGGAGTTPPGRGE